MKKLKLPEKKKLSPISRMILFIAGLVMASSLIVYGITWNNVPMILSFLGIQINQWVIASLMVFIGILSASMMKSAILGTYRLD